MNMKDEKNFQKIKELTNGYLEAGTYQKMYEYALNAPAGCVVDIGPAQGGSTICFGLAVKENKKLNKIYSIDKYHGSNALWDYSDVAKNLRVLKRNLAAYGLEDMAVPIVYGQDDCNAVIGSQPTAVLFIDADGAIDRDMERYYNQIADDGIIIIDDYELKINIQAETRYLKWRSDEQIEEFLKENGVDNLLMFTPLGKHYTTYKLTEYLIRNGYMEMLDCSNNTLFARKCKNSPCYTYETKQAMMQIREEILTEFQQRREKIMAYYDKVELWLKKLMKKHFCYTAMLLERYYYPAKSRYHVVKVLEISADENCKKEYVHIQDINIEDIRVFYDDLKTGRCVDISGKELADSQEYQGCVLCGLGTDFYEGSVHMIPVMKEAECMGIIILCSHNSHWDGIKQEEMYEDSL